MDLGKMLAEALDAHEIKSGFVGSLDGQTWGIDGFYDLPAAAAAFLAKVREAEKSNGAQETDIHMSQGPTHSPLPPGVTLSDPTFLPIR